MTIKQFSDKYGIPYYMVYEAAYKVDAEQMRWGDRSYPEKELRDSVLRSLKRKAIKTRQRTIALCSMIDNITGARGKRDARPDGTTPKTRSKERKERAPVTG